MTNRDTYTRKGGNLSFGLRSQPKGQSAPSNFRAQTSARAQFGGLVSPAPGLISRMTTAIAQHIGISSKATDKHTNSGNVEPRDNKGRWTNK